jgi:hypothetical protein
MPVLINDINVGLRTTPPHSPLSPSRLASRKRSGHWSCSGALSLNYKLSNKTQGREPPGHQSPYMQHTPTPPPQTNVLTEEADRITIP